jgi:hypothetical protein
MPLLRATTKTKRRRRRRSAATTSRWLVLPLPLVLLQRLLGAMAHMVTSGRGSPPAVMRVVYGVRYTTPGATMQRKCREIKKHAE